MCAAPPPSTRLLAALHRKWDILLLCHWDRSCLYGQDTVPREKRNELARFTIKLLIWLVGRAGILPPVR